LACELRVTSVAPPTISHRCPRCPRCPSGEFVCSELFRLNTHGKLADIWLIYRCARCDATKNVTVVERTRVARVPKELFDAALTNDGAVARRLARDVGLLKRNGLRVCRGDDFKVEGITEDAAFRLTFDEPLLVRLDHVIAAATGLTRSRVRRLHGGAELTRLRLVSDTDVVLAEEPAS
jgi:hypothetical protein